MGIRLVVAVTDREWFDHLRLLSNPSEVNFWAPSATQFRALSPGEIFLFKLHSPDNFIVGGGIFAYANVLPCSLAWEAFEKANGASSLHEMRDRIARYRRSEVDSRGDFQIGCRILTQPFFFDRDRWIDLPPSWSPNIVTFKTYSTDDADGKYIWDTIQDRTSRREFDEEQSRYGEPVLVHPRLGQGAFRILVTDNYHRRCAVTGERTLPALDAAHIRPYSDGGMHAVSNGLLLRRDIHSLFDAGYVTVTPNYQFEVSKRIKEEFENGRDYYALKEKLVSVPENPNLRPDPTALSWHNNERFLG
ncbi:MAG TPA: HNH endonuclease [Xanthobacteraceae bacterium]|nr:HNH endonuclease [Xanthobacteraceae bacterium]